MAGWIKFHLNKEQFEELVIIEKQVNKPQLLKKIQCIKLKSKWREHKDVWEFLGVSIQTITSRTKIYFEWWIKKLLSRNYKGKITVFTPKMLEEIRQKNKEKPFDTAKEAKVFIEEKYWFKFHLHYVQKLVKKNFTFHIRSRK